MLALNRSLLNKLSWLPQFPFFITPRRGPRRHHPVSPVACVTVSAAVTIVVEACLLRRCTATAAAPLFASSSLPSNGSLRHSMFRLMTVNCHVMN
jgi:hypothetical protein